MEGVKTTVITGTYRILAVGEVYCNAPFQQWGEYSQVSFKVLRISDEQEYRAKYNYAGPLPPDMYGREPNFYEVVALD